jgi:hypothetical protein
MTRLSNSGDFHPAANGSTVTQALTDNGGDRAITMIGGALVTYDTGVKLTPDARGSIKIATPDGTTTTAAYVIGFPSGGSPSIDTSFDFIMQWDINNTQTCDIAYFYDNATSSAKMFSITRASGGIITLKDKANAAVSGTPTGAVLLAANGAVRFSGRIKAGAGTADGIFQLKCTRISDGVVLFDYTSSALNTGTVAAKNVQVGKMTATAAAGFGISLHLQNLVFEDGLGAPTEPFPIWTGKGVLDKILVPTGASNMVGRETTDGLNDLYDSRVWYIPQRGANMGRPIKAKEYLRHPDPTIAFGPINAFVAAFIAGGRLAANERLLIVPRAYGGTGFSRPDSNNPGEVAPFANSMTWQPSALTQSDSRNLFWGMVTAVNAAKALAGAGSTVVAIIHNAGSTDGINNVEKEPYRVLFLEFIDALRAQLGATIPFMMMQSRPSLMTESRHRFIDEVQQETAGVKTGGTKRPYTGYSFSPAGDEYKASGDVVHFNGAGYRLIGAGLYGVMDDAERNLPAGAGPVQWFDAIYVGTATGAVLADSVRVNGETVWTP